ncbi:hypothetical protein EKO04_008079 [Ascochyta lentis]|uniref:Uncharacterized protein n=1 Tax=Ascochyta lentis TaxID=205686 RepID=A0A8H7IXA2_9PLEO|nr:hypothetical protein EKO04_008079 [Ascochyta lentis]
MQSQSTQSQEVNSGSSSRDSNSSSSRSSASKHSPLSSYSSRSHPSNGSSHSPQSSPSVHEESTPTPEPEDTTLEPIQAQNAQPSNIALLFLFSDALAAFNHYQGLYRKTSSTHRYLVELTADEYATLLYALEQNPSLHDFVLSSMTTNVNEFFRSSLRESISCGLRRIMDAISNEDEASELVQRIDAIGQPTIKLEIVQQTPNSADIETFIVVPDEAFTFDRRDLPYVVIEVR